MCTCAVAWKPRPRLESIPRCLVVSSFPDLIHQWHHIFLHYYAASLCFNTFTETDSTKPVTLNHQKVKSSCKPKVSRKLVWYASSSDSKSSLGSSRAECILILGGFCSRVLLPDGMSCIHQSTSFALKRFNRR